jgi:hypothetical protein
LQIDLKDLRRHYASLADEEILALDRAELTEVARKCYDEEFARRGLKEEAGGLPRQRENRRPDAGLEIDPDWLESAACACSFATQSARPFDEAPPGDFSAASAANARDVLEAAGIPCRISGNPVELPSSDPPPTYEYRVMVPGGLSLRAASVLDKEVFNTQTEAEWKTHFESLSDEELRTLDPEAICAGLQDRIERMKRAYGDELARRKLRPR